MPSIVLPGQPGAINDIDVTQAEFRDQIGAIATATRRLAGGTAQGISTTSLYVDPEIGTDDWESGIVDATAVPPLTNQQLTAGYAKGAPFKTLQRALIEAARLSIIAGANNDLFDRVVIRVSPGEHIIDNAPAGSATVSSWGSSFSPSAENLRAFNGSKIGVILPRGVSIVGEDLRKSVIRPSTVPASNLNPSTERGAVFKATGGSFFFNFTFKDALNLTSSHHLLSAFEFCSEAELSAYYTKVCTAFGIDPAAAEIINPGETEITTSYPDGAAQPSVDSTKGSSAYVFNCSLRSDYGMCGMFLDGAQVSGFKSMVVAQFTNVSLQKDMNAWEIYSGGQWTIPASYAAYISADINNVRYRIGGAFNHQTGCYETDYRNFGFKCINDSILQEVSCFVIGNAVHHWTASGGECTITNSNSNFGLTALMSSGFRGIGTADGAFPQDKGFLCKSVRRPLKLRTDGSNIRQISIGTVAGYDAATGTITLNAAFDPLVTFGRFGYSLKQGDYLWIENRSRDTGPGFVPNDKNASTAVDVRAELAATPWDENNATKIQVNPSGDLAINNISTMDLAILLGNRVYIRRLVDTRTPSQRKYTLIAENSNTTGTRRPVGNFVMRLGNRTSLGEQVDPVNSANQVFLVSESSIESEAGTGASNNYRLTIRPGDSATSFTPGRYYRVGTPIANAGRVFRAKRNKVFSTFALEEWEPSLSMLPNERGVESLRIAIGPELFVDKDLSNDPDSFNLGINQETDPDILGQIRSSTDFVAIARWMEALGYSPTAIGSQSTGSLAGTVLEPQASQATQDWDPSSLSSPVPSGKLTARGYWPLEFNRPSLIRAFGQAYEWAGQGNYSKAMPKYQVTVLSDQHKIDFFAVNHLGGRVYNTGFNEDGLIVQGDTINDLGTNTIVTTEVAGLGALSGDPDFPVVPTSFDTLTVTDEFNSLLQATFNNITINGVIDGSPIFAPNALPVASTTVQGIVQIATNTEALAFDEIDKAITPATLGDVRGAVDGIASLDNAGTVPLSQIPSLPDTKLPTATTTGKGVIEIATDIEAKALADSTRAITASNLSALRGAVDGFASLDSAGTVPLVEIPALPSNKLPSASTTAQGVVELATDGETAALADTDRAITPASLGSVRGAADGFASLDGASKVPISQLPAIPVGNLPSATETAKGIVELATNAEVAALTDTERAITPSGLGSVRAAANGFASLDASTLLPTAQLPEIPLANIPVLTNAKLPVLELAKLPIIPASKLLTTPIAWVSGNVNFNLSGNFTFAHSGVATTLGLGAASTAGFIGTSGFIYVTNATGLELTGINDATWVPITNTWIDPTDNNLGLDGNLLIGYYIAAAGVVIYTASKVG